MNSGCTYGFGPEEKNMASLYDAGKKKIYKYVYQFSTHLFDQHLDMYAYLVVHALVPAIVMLTVQIYSG